MPPNAGQKSTCSLHINSVLIAKPRNQVLFFSSAPDYEEREHQAARDKEKPVCCSKCVGDNGQGERGIERTSNPTVRTDCHQCTVSVKFLPRFCKVQVSNTPAITPNATPNQRIPHAGHRACSHLSFAGRSTAPQPAAEGLASPWATPELF